MTFPAPFRVFLRSVVNLLLISSAAAWLTGCHALPGPRDGMALDFPAARASDAEFRVVAWNVKHFVDPYDSPYIQNEWDDRRTGMEDPGRVDLFVEALRVLNADVVVLEEFENSAWLESLAKTRFPEMDYGHFAAAEEQTWHQNVVVMSRFPLGVVYSFANVSMPIEGAEDSDGNPAAQNLTNHRLLGVEVFVDDDYDFLLLALHLKAGGGDRNRGWRLGQIDFLRAWLRRHLPAHPETNVLVAGDLNATPETPEIVRLLGTGQDDWTKDGAGVTDTRDEFGEAGAGKTPDAKQRNDWDDLDDEERALRFVDPLGGEHQPTAPSRDPRRRIDYLLPNANMASEYVADSLQVARPLADKDMQQVSDHLPVLALFRAEDR